MECFTSSIVPALDLEESAGLSYVDGEGGRVDDFEDLVLSSGMVFKCKLRAGGDQFLLLVSTFSCLLGFKTGLLTSSSDRYDDSRISVIPFQLSITFLASSFIC